MTLQHNPFELNRIDLYPFTLDPNRNFARMMSSIRNKKKVQSENVPLKIDYQL